MPDINLGNLKLGDGEIEKTLERVISGLNKAEQEALQAMISIKSASDAAQAKALQNATKTTEAQKKQINQLLAGLQTVETKSVETAKKSSSAFSGFGSSLKKSLNILGQLTGIGTLVSLLSKAGREVANFVGEFSKTKEGAKQLEGINLQWAKMKAVAGDFLKNSLEKIIPILDKVLPKLQSGFQTVTAVIAATAAGGKAFISNLASEFQIFANNLKIGFLSLKAYVTGSDEAKQKIKELKDENEGLRKSHVDVATVAKAAFDEQKASAKAAADNARVTTGLTKEQANAIKKLREEYSKLLADFNKDVDTASFDAIASPFKKLDVTRENALNEIEKTRQALVDASKKSGIALPLDFELKIQILKEQAETAYRQELAKLLNSLRTINIEELATDKNNLDDLISNSLKGTFNIPQSLFDEAKNAGIQISKIAGYLFVNPTDQAVIDEGLKDNENAFKDKMLKHVQRTQKLTQDIIKKQKPEKTNQNFIAGLLGISDEDFSLVANTINKGINASFQAAQDKVNGQIDDNNRLIESIRNRVSVAQEALNQELELQRNGSANNVATRQRELEALKKQETEALRVADELNRKKVRQQLAQDALVQASNMITTGTNLFASETLGKGVAGLIFAALAIPTMLALFARLRASAKGAASEGQKAYRGGDLSRDYGLVAGPQGHTDRAGGKGHRVEGTNLIIGGDEYLNKSSVTKKHRPFLDRLNSGEFDGLNILEVIDKRNHAIEVAQNISREAYASLPDLVSEEKKLRKAIKIDLKNQAINREEMKELMEMHVKKMQNISDEKPDYIPISKDQVGYIKVSKNKREKILF